MDENKTQPNDKNIKVLRTYTSDMAEAIRNNEMSVIKIAMAEKEKREQEALYKQAEGTNTSKTFLVIGGVILIAVAIFGSYFLIQKKKESVAPEMTISNIETFISYDSKSYIDITNVNDVSVLANLIKNVKQENSSLVNAFFLTTQTATTEPTLVTTNDFLSILKSTVPGALTRSISDEYLLGKYSNINASNDNDKSAMFLIFGTTDYALAYSSMLDWEKTMLKDLQIIFNIDSSKLNSQIYEKQWKDIIINNKDVRVLYGDSGEGILYYVFVNKNNFVITSSVEAMKEIIARLITKGVNQL